MNVVSFRYDDETWLKLEAIVSRAGGDAAREKFASGRANFEKQADGWKARIAKWDGQKWGPDDADKYQRIERAALELVAVLEDFSFPAIFSGNDLVWNLGEPGENNERFSKFRGAVKHVGLRAKMMATPKRKRTKYIRDLFFASLMETWRLDLGLHIGENANSPLNKFIEAASVGVYKFPKEDTAKEVISNVVRRWKAGVERKVAV